MTGVPSSKAAIFGPKAFLARMGIGTRSRVSHFMNKLSKLGCIDYNGEIVVRPSLLHAVLNDRLQGEQQV